MIEIQRAIALFKFSSDLVDVFPAANVFISDPDKESDELSDRWVTGPIGLTVGSID